MALAHIKKAGIFIFIEIICVVIGFIILAGVFLYYSKLSVTPEMSPDQAKMSLINNKSKFIEAKDIIGKYNELLSVSRDGNQNSNNNDGRFYYTIKGKIYVKSETKLGKNNLFEIENSSIPFLLSKLGILDIVKINGPIYFIEGATFGEVQGIIFTPDGKEPIDQYIKKIERIDSNWFYYISE